MKKKYTLALFCFFVLASFTSNAQVFWTETFSSGCASLCQLPYTGVNGAWTWVSTGTNGAAANTWFVSLAEGGLGRGACGKTGTGTDASLHVGNVSNSPAAFIFCPTGDCGAACDYSACCPDVTANARATSPVINCTGKNTITLSFNYLEDGLPGVDYATVDYYNGTTWATLSTPGVTALCGVQGKWTHYTIALPASANNNANVQVGFNWHNTAGNSGSDPSFAVDSVQLSTPPVALPPVANFTCNDSTICVGDSVHFIDKSTNGPTSWSWTFTGGSPATSTNQNPVVYYGTAGTYTVKEVVKNINGSDSITKTSYIHVLVGPTITLKISSDSVCAGGVSTIKATGGGTYAWSTGSTADSITVNPLSTTTYTLGVNNGTCTKDTSVTIVVIPSPSPIIKGSDSICVGGMDTLSVSGAASYSWSTGATTSSIIVSPASTITYSVTASNGKCTVKATFTVTVLPVPVASITGKDTICKGGNTVLSASGGTSYLWSNGATTSSVLVSPAASKGYTVTVSNGKCSSKDSVKVIVENVPVPTISPNDSVCPGNPVLIVAGGGTTYSWKPNPGGLSCYTCDSTFANIAGKTTYTVTVSNGPCSAIDSVTLSVRKGPSGTAQANTTIAPGQSASISYTPTAAGETYMWLPNTNVSCDNCPSTNVSPTVTTEYYVIVTDTTDKCSIKDSVLITVELPCGKVFIPDAFSPNGDGQNDVYYIKFNESCVATMEFNIYDRWGNKIFTANSVSSGWDGTYKGQPMNSGTYVYYLNLTDKSGNNYQKKGNITLVR
jgi:gliding motility-associated-like protein